ncbi:hypothetical protein RI543_002717 [Arxiozyma heterogenica]|uniref:Mitochondrial acidic protein MAM33 n=1 Tax=Arxiozyma heterogenica TaxID=278026 RepID=A0AAN7WHA7_9SACH|nr:hypothetical protein RI543_002717 [Kazachstania heterogenica]
MSLNILHRSIAKSTIANIAKATSCRQPLNRVGLIASTFHPVRTFFTTQYRDNQQRQAVNDILNSEYKIEKDLASTEQSPDMFRPYLEKSNFSIVETPGKNEAKLVKKTDSGETVHVFFDVAQVVNLPFDDLVTEENIAAAEDNNDETFDSLDDNFANVTVVVSHEGNGSAVSFDLLMNLQDRSFYIDSVTPFKSAADILHDTAESQFNNDLKYRGPPFSNLDEGLQESLELYLESRGVNEELSEFICTYSEFKENNEYISWLEDMKGFFKNK